MTLVLNNDEIEKLLTMDVCLDVLENLYREYGNGKTVDLPRCDASVPLGTEEKVYALKTMSGCVPFFGKAAIRLNSDVIHWPSIGGAKRREKIPAASGGRWVGLVLLFDIHTGEPSAIFPDGILQRMRVGATNGLAAKYLSREDSRVLALIGSGWQAGSQAMAFCATRKIREVRVYSKTKDHREAFCEEMEPRLHVNMVPVETPDKAVQGADIIAAATSSMVPVIQKEWLKPGVHVSSIKKQELNWEVVSGCRPFFFHTKHILTQTNYYMESDQGPHAEVEKGWWSEKKDQVRGGKAFPDMGDLLTGKVPGRTKAEQITGFLNNVGLGIQFAAVGARVCEMALEQGMGRNIPTDWFLESVHP